jgi:hypothetical protein
MDIQKIIKTNLSMKLRNIVGILILIGIISYTIAHSRRVLVPKYDERFIIILESGIIFLIAPTTKPLFASFKEFQMKDIKSVILSSFAGAFVAIFWVYVVRSSNIADYFLSKRSVDLVIILCGAYLLFSEQVNMKKSLAFVLLLTAIYLMSY